MGGVAREHADGNCEGADHPKEQNVRHWRWAAHHESCVRLREADEEDESEKTVEWCVGHVMEKAHWRRRKIRASARPRELRPWPVGVGTTIPAPWRSSIRC